MNRIGLIFSLNMIFWLVPACSVINPTDVEIVSSSVLIASDRQSVSSVGLQVRYRENIDSLPPDKLAAYEHAVAR